MIKHYAFLLILAISIVVSPAISAAQDVSTVAKQAIVIDYQTGQVLFEKNPDEKMPTSSMSKVMTMYLVFEALKKGDLSLDDSFVVSEKAWKKGGSKMFVPVGEKVKIEDLIRGVVVQSGNDATIVLAEGLAGDEVSFAAALNKKAQELGMTNSHFMNASGWPDPDHYSTARDLATLASAVIREFPEYYKYYSETEFTYHDIKQANRNPLLKKNIGADGLKTGHTDIGGYGLIGTGVKDGRRVIMVLNGMENSKQREEEAVRLLQWGLNGFKNLTLFENGKDLDRAEVYLGQKPSVGLRAEHDIEIVIPKLYENKLKVDVVFSGPLKAPVSAGQVVGEVVVTLPNETQYEVPLVTSETVEQMSFFQRTIAKARLLTTGKGYFD